MSAEAESTWPKHPDGSNKTIGEMTPEEARPLLRAAFLRSKIGEVVPHLASAFADYCDEQDPAARIRAANATAQNAARTGEAK